MSKDGVILNGEGGNEKFKLPKLCRKVIKALIVIVVLLVIAVVVQVKLTGGINFEIFRFNNKSITTIETITESTITDVFEINELQTAEYIYNAVVTVCDDNGNVKYYVSYQGTVTAGIDFNEIDIDINTEQKTIVITVPDVNIVSTRVDDALEFIFMNKKYDEKDTYNEAYSACKTDINENAKKDDRFLNMAKENTRQVIEAMVSPWVKQIARQM